MSTLSPESSVLNLELGRCSTAALVMLGEARPPPCWEPGQMGPQEKGPSYLGTPIVEGGGTGSQSKLDVDPKPRSPGPPVFLSVRSEAAHRGLWTRRDDPGTTSLRRSCRASHCPLSQLPHGEQSSKSLPAPFNRACRQKGLSSSVPFLMAHCI